MADLGTYPGMLYSTPDPYFQRALRAALRKVDTPRTQVAPHRGKVSRLTFPSHNVLPLYSGTWVHPYIW